MIKLAWSATSRNIEHFEPTLVATLSFHSDYTRSEFCSLSNFDVQVTKSDLCDEPYETVQAMGSVIILGYHFKENEIF